MPAFWDASALVPLCLPGEDGGRGRQLLREHSPVVWWGTTVEIASAIARLGRQRQLTPAQQQAARSRLDRLRQSWREVEPTSRLRDLAEVQVQRFELRAAEALQLAAALVWCQGRPRRRAFLCRDQRLKEAAGQAGFAVIEP